MEPFLRSVARRLAEQADAFEPEVALHTRYALVNQGKQLRPALVALSAHATGGLNDDLVTVAAIIEMVHLATLVHDDVMDAAEIRRRQPTLAAQSGNSVSVLVGDCLFAHALKLAAGFPTPDVCRAVASATKVVCSGETIQTLQRGEFPLTREAYYRILRMKTGELFALSCELGARISGATEAEQQALRNFGMALGTAYQVYDDCLDLFGSEERAGKSLGTDLVGGKLTLPIIVALENADPAERHQLKTLLEGWEIQRLSELRQILEQRGALPEAREVIHSLCLSAQENLVVLRPGEGQRCLAAAAQFVAQQTDRLGVGPG